MGGCLGGRPRRRPGGHAEVVYVQEPEDGSAKPEEQGNGNTLPQVLTDDYLADGDDGLKPREVTRPPIAVLPRFEQEPHGTHGNRTAVQDG